MKRFADSRHLGVSATAAIAIVAASAAAGAAEPTPAHRPPKQSSSRSASMAGCASRSGPARSAARPNWRPPGATWSTCSTTTNKPSSGGADSCGRPACTAWCPPTGCPVQADCPIRRTSSTCCSSPRIPPRCRWRRRCGSSAPTGSWWSAARERPRANWSHSASRLSGRWARAASGSRGKSRGPTEWTSGRTRGTRPRETPPRATGWWPRPAGSAGSPARRPRSAAWSPPPAAISMRACSPATDSTASASGSTTWLRPPASGSR